MTGGDLDSDKVESWSDMETIQDPKLVVPRVDDVDPFVQSALFCW